MSKMAEKIFANLRTAPIIWTTGVGKSAAVAELLARFFRNVGKPAAFLCPTEYWHGGRGAVKPEHALILVSASGATSEIVAVAQDVQCFTVHLGNVEREGLADAFWRAGTFKGGAVQRDSIPLTMAAIDMVEDYAKQSGVSAEDAARFHPAGKSLELV